ncbi:MAG: DUF4339 domain-containing protein [Verrucomicrobiota bacterium]|jgi:hypothetical protein
MATYTIIGGDQKPYSSVTADDIRRWIADGRLNEQSFAKEENDTEWRPLSAFPEFADALGAGSTPPPPFGSPEAVVSEGHTAALQLVKGPAIALIITASLGVAYYGFSGLFTLFTGGVMFHQEMPPEIPPQMRAFIAGMQGPLAGVINLAVAALNGFVLFGAIKLLRLQNHSVATVASVAAMLPCQCCCLFGLPFGIWALVVLNKPEVKSQFT